MNLQRLIDHNTKSCTSEFRRRNEGIYGFIDMITSIERLNFEQFQIINSKLPELSRTSKKNKKIGEYSLLKQCIMVEYYKIPHSLPLKYNQVEYGKYSGVLTVVRM